MPEGFDSASVFVVAGEIAANGYNGLAWLLVRIYFSSFSSI